MSVFSDYQLDYETPVDDPLQQQLDSIDARLRTGLNIPADRIAVGLLDLKQLRLALIRPDHCEYAASIPKIGILLAWFHIHPEAATHLTEQTRHELGLMIKASDNDLAAKFSSELGLKNIQAVLNQYGFYDAARHGGIWVGKHYGRTGERYGDPLHDHSHAATVRQLLRYFLLLEQEKLISPRASQAVRRVFESPEIPHDEIKFLSGVESTYTQIIRKWGSWEDWLHDSMVLRASNRHYILAALTHHPRGDEYLVELARHVDRMMTLN